MCKRRTLICVLATILPLSGAVAESRGAPTVIDGKTLDLGGQRYVLAGIDVPDADQRCRWGDKEIRCGLLAKTALMDLVAGAEVTCIAVARTNTKDPSIGRCRAGGFDLGGNMMHTGWAVALDGAPESYVRVQGKARAAGRGLWRGRFVMPALWRQGVRLD